MRKIFLSIWLAVALAANAAVAQAAPAAPAAPEPQLVEIVGPDGHFSIKFPGAPQYGSDLGKLNGTTETFQINRFYVSLQNDNVAYMLMYNDYPADADTTSPSALLEQVRAGAADGKTVLSDDQIVLNGLPGRAFTTRDPKTGYNYDEHAFLVGKRLYQIIVVTGKDYTAPNRDAFLNSFNLR
jgi:hypothetical protein